MSETAGVTETVSEAANPRLSLGPRALELVTAKAKGGRIRSLHLDEVIEDFERQISELRRSTDAVTPQDVLTELRSFRAEQISGRSRIIGLIETSTERLLNTMNGIRYLFELYAVRLSGGDLQEAVHEVNERIDGLAKPIADSKAEVEMRREKERADAGLEGVGAVEIEQVMQVADGAELDGEAASFAARDDTVELGR